MREILMIDDKFSKWHPVLEKAARECGFEIINTPSVEEGLIKLQLYRGAIDAVILGLTFGDGKMQGKEGLIKIREIDDSLPVVILTAKTDDLQLISECIRLGAFDYFSKPSINTGILFLQIEKAIQQSNQHKKLKIISRSGVVKNIITPIYRLFGSENSLTGYFAYRLTAMACASFQNKHETEFLSQLAYEWHLNLLNTVSFYDCGLTLRLRYLHNPGDDYIDIALIVEFNAESPELAASRFKQIHEEFDIIMQAKKDYGKTVYFFIPVTEEKDLDYFLMPFETEHLVQFTTESSIHFPSDRKPIGFMAGFNYDREKIYLPLLTKPEIKIDRFCEQMVHHKTSTMVEVTISPFRLSSQDIDHLRDIVLNVNSYKYTESEKMMIISIISDYLKAPSNCFRVEVFEAQQSERIGENMLSAITSAFFNSESDIKVSRQSRCKEGILKRQNEKTGKRIWSQIYSPGNIINVFKLPYPLTSSIPGIKTINPIFGFIPENMNAVGILAGLKQDNGHSIPVRIGETDLRKHLYVLGQTGTGKTTLLYSMIMDRIVSGKGLCVIDPHGDLHKMILEYLPAERRKDLIVFEPGNPENDIRINLLEYRRDFPQEKSFLIDDLFNFFRQEYSAKDTMGPVFELFMKNSLLLLMDDPDHACSIGDLTSIFQNADFRSYLISTCKDKEVVDFWQETAIKLTGESALVNIAPYIVSKLNQLLINEYIKPIVVTPKSNIDFREVIDNNKILLISLSKGKIGKIGVNILGTIVLSKIVNAALSREDMPENERQDFTLFVDEFQNFVSASLISAMSEARKYRLSLVLANQTLGQLNESIKESVLGNVGSTIFFRPGINDVDYIMPYFTPYLSRENVLTLPNFKCIGRIQMNNLPSLPFIFDTIHPDNINETLIRANQNNQLFDLVNRFD